MERKGTNAQCVESVKRNMLGGCQHLQAEPCAHCAAVVAWPDLSCVTLDMRTLGGAVITVDELDVPAKLRYSQAPKQ